MAPPKKQQPQQAASNKQTQTIFASSQTQSSNIQDDDFSADLIKQVNKEAGMRKAFNLGTDEAPTTVKRWISTGSRQLDYIISNRRNGGLPEGRIIEIQGPTSIGKSHLTYEVAKATQRMGGIVVYIDTENATSVENLESVGVDVRKRFVFIQETCIEEIFKVIESTIEKARNLKADVPVTVIWDSVAASAPKAEIDGEYDQNTIGLAARVLSKGFRKITHVIGDKNVCLLLVNQQRVKIGCVHPETNIVWRKTPLVVSPIAADDVDVCYGTMDEFFQETGHSWKQMEINQPIDVAGYEIRTLQNGLPVWKKVKRIVRKPETVRYTISSGDNSLVCSGEHKVFVRSKRSGEEGFLEVRKCFESEHWVGTENGWRDFIVSLDEQSLIPILDIEVEDCHSYLSEGFLSHNTMYGDPSTTPGGMAIPYHSSVRIKLTGGQQLKKTINGKEAVIGIEVTAKTIKNKVARPWREVSFEIHFGRGIMESEQLFDELRQYCDKVSDPVLMDGKKVEIAGTGAWKNLLVTDHETGEILQDVKFYKSDFQSKVLNDPNLLPCVLHLCDAAFIMKSNHEEHHTIASVDTSSAAEVEALRMEQGGREILHD